LRNKIVRRGNWQTQQRWRTGDADQGAHIGRSTWAGPLAAKPSRPGNNQVQGNPMSPLYSELQWLPRPGPEFRERLKKLDYSSGRLGRELQWLASHALDVNQLTKLANAMGRGRLQGRSLDPLVPFRLALLSNSTIDLIVPALVASAARHGIALEVIQPSYD